MGGLIYFLPLFLFYLRAYLTPRAVLDYLYTFFDECGPRARLVASTVYTAVFMNSISVPLDTFA
jgi:hypothetical protein